MKTNSKEGEYEDQDNIEECKFMSKITDYYTLGCIDYFINSD